jgi:hypothetical protein
MIDPFVCRWFPALSPGLGGVFCRRFRGTGWFVEPQANKNREVSPRFTVGVLRTSCLWLPLLFLLPYYSKILLTQAQINSCSNIPIKSNKRRQLGRKWKQFGKILEVKGSDWEENWKKKEKVFAIHMKCDNIIVPSTNLASYM